MIFGLMFFLAGMALLMTQMAVFDTLSWFRKLLVDARAGLMEHDTDVFPDYNPQPQTPN